MSKRISALDMAKGTAIILVVVGHIVARDDIAPGAQWYADLRALIYLFHMPLFMALSGMALGLSWRHRSSLAEVGELVVRRFRQLMVPFIVFGLIVLVGKLTVSQWTTVDNPAGDFTDSLLAILLNPFKSPSAFLWYIQVLAVYYLFVPWMMQASSRWTPPLLLVLGLAANLRDEWPTLMSIDACVKYLPFFATGMLLGQYWDRLCANVLDRRLAPLWLLPFAAMLVYSQVDTPLPLWLVGAASIPFMLTAHQWPQGRLRDVLIWAGTYTLSIYLMNTICIGVAKALLKTVVPYEGHWFIVFFIALGLAGLIVPVLVRKVLVRWRPGLAAYL